MYKVFLVDDEPFILEGLRNIINWQDFGLEISGQAANGLDACSILEREKADILITDITMPKMNGLDLIKNLKAMDSNIKFIVLSGYNEFDFVKAGIALGIENYLLKPINVQELLSTLANTCEKLESSKFKEIIEKKDNNILKDNILYRWVTNKIASMELRERSRILQISLEHNYYNACIVKIAPTQMEGDSSADAEWVSRFPEIFESCCSLVGQSESQMCFSNPDGEVVLVFGVDSIETGKPFIHEKLDEMERSVSCMPGLDVFITMGDFQAGFMNLYKSYANAKKMQDYRLVSPWVRIYYYDETNQCKDSDISCSKVDYQQFSKLLLSKNKDAVSAFISNVFVNLNSSPGMTPSYIQNCCMEMVININRTLENFDYNVIGNDYRELFNSMIEMHTLAQLESLMRNIADNALNCFITGDNKVSPIIKQVLNYINKHYTDELSLKTLGYELNINPVYLGQLFQKETGQLFNEYINIFKMQKAQQLLLNTNLKAIDISRRVGFSDPNYFFKQFKKYVGVSPTELRSCKNAEAQ